MSESSTANSGCSMWPARIYLSVVGILYVGLGVWCAALPDRTSRSVGFQLTGGSGQSEFLVVYGGLELALGIAFLWPLFRRDDTLPALKLCCLIHACLAAFRTAGFLMFEDIGRMTWSLAAGEWSICISSVVVLLKICRLTRR